MRIANYQGRAVVVEGDKAYDIERVSGGRFGPDPDTLFRNWQEFAAAAGDFQLAEGEAVQQDRLGPPVACPRQLFAIGLNYRDHARETGMEVPQEPLVFTKFQSSIAGPTDTVTLPSEYVDYEVELVVVIGREARDVDVADAWDHVAGVTVGQDFSERKVQNRGAAPQFSLGKSYPGFSPMGPHVVTPDELPNRDELRLTTQVLDGSDEPRTLQDGTTADLIFDVPTLIAKLSAIVTLLPGDVIFTGTPAGVGIGRDPKLFLQPGWTLVSEIEGVGTMSNPLV